MGSLDEAGLLDELEAAVLALVQAAPAGSPAQLAQAAAIAFSLAHAVAAGAGPEPGEAPEARIAGMGAERVGLLCAMERCLELIGEGLVDAGVALPALAMAAYTARSSEAGATASIAAARYEIETLLPAPGATPAPRKTLDVPAHSLVRRPLQVVGEPRASIANRVGTAALVDLTALASRWPEAAQQQVLRARQRLR
jgi:hypothetical protein